MKKLFHIIPNNRRIREKPHCNTMDFYKEVIEPLCHTAFCVRSPLNERVDFCFNYNLSLLSRFHKIHIRNSY